MKKDILTLLNDALRPAGYLFGALEGADAKTLPQSDQRLKSTTAMTKIPTLLTALLLASSLFSQTEKSATPLVTQNSNPNTQNSTRAVVIGWT